MSLTLAVVAHYQRSLKPKRNLVLIFVFYSVYKTQNFVCHIDRVLDLVLYLSGGLGHFRRLSASLRVVLPVMRPTFVMHWTDHARIKRSIM